MSTHSEKVWIIYLKGIGIIEGTHTKRRYRSIENFMWTVNRMSEEVDGNSSTWKETRAQGYRCVRATLTREAQRDE